MAGACNSGRIARSLKVCICRDAISPKREYTASRRSGLFVGQKDGEMLARRAGATRLSFLIFFIIPSQMSTPGRRQIRNLALTTPGSFMSPCPPCLPMLHFAGT